jgi:hypothetical protein
MKSIIYLIEQPLDLRNYERFGIQNWRDNGWVVEIWDLTPLTADGVWRDFFKSGGTLFNYDAYHPITSILGLIKNFLLIKKPLYCIDLTGNDLYSVAIKLFLKLFLVKIIIFESSLLPKMVTLDAGTVDPKKNHLRLKIVNFFKTYLKKIISPDIAVVYGEKENGKIRNPPQIINAHAWDYDVFLSLKDKNEAENSKIVFVDQNLCLHSDFMRQGESAPVSIESYYPSMRCFIGVITAEIKLPFVVSAHPRAYGGYSNFFGEEVQIETGSTASLIKDAKVVIGHYSTALQYAILFKKPIIFITTNQLENSKINDWMTYYAAQLGKKIINIDEDLKAIDWAMELNVDYEKYNQYIERYIKNSDSLDINSWEIINFELIKKLKN